MDEGTIRNTLDELRNELEQLDSRRERVLEAYRGLEALLALHTSAGNPPLFTMLSTNSKTKPKGKRSMRGAVRKVIREAHGQPLHSTEILRRARALGANTAAKNPAAIIDLLMYAYKGEGYPVEKTEPRTWRWAGDSINPKDMTPGGSPPRSKSRA